MVLREVIMRPIYYELQGENAVRALDLEAAGVTLVGAAEAVVRTANVAATTSPGDHALFDNLGWRGEHAADIDGERWCAMLVQRGLERVVVVSRGPTLFFLTPAG